MCRGTVYEISPYTYTAAGVQIPNPNPIKTRRVHAVTDNCVYLDGIGTDRLDRVDRGVGSALIFDSEERAKEEIKSRWSEMKTRNEASMAKLQTQNAALAAAIESL